MRKILVLVLTAAAVSLVGAGVLPAARANTGRVATSSSLVTSGRQLTAVSALSDTDAWAVGYITRSTGEKRTLIRHWDGTTWSRVKSPNPNPEINVLMGVSFRTPSEGWAVGWTSPTTVTAGEQTMVLHWDGVKWSRVDSPDRGSIGSYLRGVRVFSANDAWAVGASFTSIAYTSRTLTLHWDGTKWSIVKSPDPNAFRDGLVGVGGVSGNRVWSVGTTDVIGVPNVSEAPLILLLQDGSWSEVATPPQTSDSWLMSVSEDPTNPNDVWAVGGSVAGGAIALHWDGVSWTQDTSPSLGSASLTGVSVLSSTDAWAVGSSGSNALVLHWDGSGWTAATTPSLTTNASLWGVSAAATDNAWAVGYTVTSDVGNGLRLGWDGVAWTQH